MPAGWRRGTSPPRTPRAPGTTTGPRTFGTRTLICSPSPPRRCRDGPRAPPPPLAGRRPLRRGVDRRPRGPVGQGPAAALLRGRPPRRLRPVRRGHGRRRAALLAVQRGRRELDDGRPV